MVDTLLGDPTLVAQARADTKKQFLESPHLVDLLLDAVSDNQDAHDRMADAFYTDSAARSEIVRLVGALLYEWVSSEEAPTGLILEVGAAQRTRVGNRRHDEDRDRSESAEPLSS